jgi:hypothetical protein
MLNATPLSFVMFPWQPVLLSHVLPMQVDHVHVSSAGGTSLAGLASSGLLGQALANSLSGALCN